jgi:RNA polymerase sigma-70 factor (ECF subfamily)
VAAITIALSGMNFRGTVWGMDLLSGLPDAAPGPEVRYEATEAISLAFITAVQLLPPRQRAVLILRDVLGYHASEVAGFLGTTEESVTSALKRARATLSQREPGVAGTKPAAAESPVTRSAGPPAAGSDAERRLVRELTAAFSAADVEAVVALLTDDAWFTVPRCRWNTRAGTWPGSSSPPRRSAPDGPRRWWRRGRG